MSLPSVEQLNIMNHSKVYATNNRYAFLWDRSQQNGNSADRKLAEQEMKMMNFVPTYDKWCLHCQKRGVESRCSKCHCVYFCDIECQKKAWPIHKKHCGRDLFTLCITCGSPLSPSDKRCEKCPVGYCSEKCWGMIEAPHIEFDCTEFQKLFGKKKTVLIT